MCSSDLGRLLLPEEVRDDRLHPRAREQDARIVLQDERRAGQAVMALLLEELDEPLSDLGALYVSPTSLAGSACNEKRGATTRSAPRVPLP